MAGLLFTLGTFVLVAALFVYVMAQIVREIRDEDDKGKG